MFQFGGKWVIVTDIAMSNMSKILKHLFKKFTLPTADILEIWTSVTAIQKSKNFAAF